MIQATGRGIIQDKTAQTLWVWKVFIFKYILKILLKVFQDILSKPVYSLKFYQIILNQVADL